MTTDLKKVLIKSPPELRQWLKKNHRQRESVWLVTYKKSVIQYYIEYSVIVDELLCFGWIDSLPRTLDNKRKMLRISPRKVNSAWSKINRDKVKKLIASKRMTVAGMAVIVRAKKVGSWARLKSTDGNVISLDLKKQFALYPLSSKNFQRFSPSSQRAILEWIAQAKTSKTRERRILRTVMMAQKNLRVLFDKAW